MPATTTQQANCKITSHQAATSLRVRLREATEQQHRTLDSQLSTLDLATIDGYRRFLEISAEALLPVEAALEAADIEQHFSDWPLRTRSAALLGDLASLGGCVRPLHEPAFEESQLFGALYALEGSRLGARYILRAVEASPDLRVSHATRYLRHGAGDRLWQSFLSALERHEETLDEEHVIEGARIVFELFSRAASLATHSAAA